MNKVGANENEEVMMQRLTNLALDFNNGNGNNVSDNIEPRITSNHIANIIEKDDSNSNEQGFNCENFFKFVSQDISENNIGKILQCMSESISPTFEKDKIQGGISSIQKVQSLKGRWFKVSIENVEQLRTVDIQLNKTAYTQKIENIIEC